MKTILAAIHGIMTNQTDPSWPDKLDAWMAARDEQVKVVKRKYAAGPFPRWNCWVEDPHLAKGLANELELFLQVPGPAEQPANESGSAQPSAPCHLRPPEEPPRRTGVPPVLDEKASRTIAASKNDWRNTSSALESDGGGAWFGGYEASGMDVAPWDEEETWDFADPRPAAGAGAPVIWFVAHSNGAMIALMTAKLLIERGHRVGGLILTGAAIEADIERNGIADWLAKGALGAALAYSSADDLVLDGDPGAEIPDTERVVEGVSPPLLQARRIRAWLWGRLMWPYGCLGRTGWLRGGADAIESPRLFTRWFQGGHSAYFAPAMLHQTFEQIYQDMNVFENRKAKI
jgi:hypothetical protein